MINMRVAVLLLHLIAGTYLYAQFYPIRNACWRLDDQGSMSQAAVLMWMPQEPDTLILGQTYKRIKEYGASDWATPLVQFNEHFVRSAEDGKGYVYLPDHLEEFLTGDVSAQQGDTVYDVFVANSLCEIPGAVVLVDVIVDSVIVHENDGIEIIRHYVHTPCYDGENASFHRHRFFWQAGIGTSAGPFMQIRPGLSPIDLLCARVDSIVLYGLGGLPGGPFTCCYPIALDVGNADSVSGSLEGWPNPAFNTLHVRSELCGESIIRLYDSTGRLVRSAPMRGEVISFDVTTLSGLYTVVQEGSKWFASSRVIID